MIRGSKQSGGGSKIFIIIGLVLVVAVFAIVAYVYWPNGGKTASKAGRTEQTTQKCQNWYDAEGVPVPIREQAGKDETIALSQAKGVCLVKKSVAPGSVGEGTWCYNVMNIDVLRQQNKIC